LEKSVDDQILQPEEKNSAVEIEETPKRAPSVESEAVSEASLEPVEEASEEMLAPETEIEGEAAPKPTEDPKRAWYVLHCYSGYENKVKKGLEQRVKSMPPEQKMEELIFRAIVPTEEELDLRKGQRKVIQRRVFPGYILVEMIITEESWYVVRNTPGVTGFVSSGDKPTPLREDEVNKILKSMETEQPKVRVTYRPGQAVHIIDGPFADFRGTVDEVNMEKGKVRVMVSFFGRETPVELDLLQVERV
jgi:transcriptional antiterminator NusG